MSVRAYRVIKEQLADDCSFNCSHDTDILDFFRKEGFWDGRDDDGCGDIDVTVETLEKLLKEFKWAEGKDYRRDAIAADIAWAKQHNRLSVEYDCF